MMLEDLRVRQGISEKQLQFEEARLEIEKSERRECRSKPFARKI